MSTLVAGAAVGLRWIFEDYGIGDNPNYLVNYFKDRISDWESRNFRNQLTKPLLITFF